MSIRLLHFSPYWWHSVLLGLKLLFPNHTFCVCTNPLHSVSIHVFSYILRRQKWGAWESERSHLAVRRTWGQSDLPHMSSGALDKSTHINPCPVGLVGGLNETLPGKLSTPRTVRVAPVFDFSQGI